MISINAVVQGAEVKLDTQPIIASGSVETIQILFSFDSAWEGFGRIALFWGPDEQVYSAPVLNGKAIVPHEAIAEKGKLRFGVYGTKGTDRITTAKLAYPIAEGAWSSEAVPSVDPVRAQNILDQILAAMSEMESEKNALIAQVTNMSFTVNDNMELIVTI